MAPSPSPPGYTLPGTVIEPLKLHHLEAHRTGTRRLTTGPRLAAGNVKAGAGPCSTQRCCRSSGHSSQRLQCTGRGRGALSTPLTSAHGNLTLFLLFIWHHYGN